jgi:catechol 2,3-dioxygenase-like lactoylglutathione lyase family enzyme
MFHGIDCLQFPVPDLEAALVFYRDRLGHELVWRTATAAGLRLPDSDAEIVIQTERPEIETMSSWRPPMQPPTRLAWPVAVWWSSPSTLPSGRGSWSRIPGAIASWCWT